MANRGNKVKPKDVDLETEEETPLDVNPPPRRRKKRNLGKERAEMEEEERRKPEYPIK